MSKKVYMVCFDASFNGESWFTQAVSSKYYYLDEEEAKDTVIEYKDFEQAYDYLKTHSSTCAHLDYTLFRHKPVIVFFKKPWPINNVRMTKKNFLPFKEKVWHREVKSYSMHELMKRLDAEDFIAFCKDRGLNTCPIQENDIKE